MNRRPPLVHINFLLLQGKNDTDVIKKKEETDKLQRQNRCGFTREGWKGNRKTGQEQSGFFFDWIGKMRDKQGIIRVIFVHVRLKIEFFTVLLV